MTPILDWYGIWPSHRKQEDDGSLWSQDPPQGVALRVQPARWSDVFLTPETLWEQDANLRIHTVLHDGGRYRLWYGVTGVEDPTRSWVCYAESDDGFGWQRPDLGLVDFAGSSRNNILCNAQDHHVGAVFTDPSAPADERYKAIAPRGRYYRDGKLDPDLTKERFKELLQAMDLDGVSPEERRRALAIRQAVHASVSADGIHWRNLDEPILDVGATQLDTHNLATFDAAAGRYVAYLRGHLERRRLVRRAEGADFRHLGQPRPCLQCDPQDPVDDDIYTSCYCPYPGQPRHLMFPSVYHRIDSTVDIQLATSRDSYQWTRPERRPIVERFCDGEEYGCLYASPNLISHGESEWRLPFVAHRRRHDFLRRGVAYPRDGELRWAVWEPHRLVGLEAAGSGTVNLVERECAGRALHLNFRTGPDGWVKPELVHPPGTPPEPVRAFEEFALDQAETLTGDELSRAVHWGGRSDLSALRGQPVAVRLHLYRATVFATAW